MRVCWKNFTGGECAPSVQARYDLEKYASSVAEMTNFFPGLHGDVQRRPGTRFVAELGGKSVLIPFSFSTDVGQNFVLVFGDKVMRVADEHGLVEGVSIETPYDADDLYEISYAQSGDIVYLAHKDYTLRKVTRKGNAEDGYVWGIEEVELNKSLPTPDKPTVVFERNNGDDSANLGYTMRYKITAVDDEGHDSLASEAGTCDGKHPSDFVEGNRVKITWQAIEGVKEYNVYREEAGYFGFIGVADAGDAVGATVSKLKMGNLEGGVLKYSGSQSRTVVVSNGYRGTEYQPVQDVDVTTKLSVVANDAQNAFLIDGKLFVWVTLRTTTTTWTQEERTKRDPETGNETQTYQWVPRTTTATASEWRMVKDVEEDSIAGEYDADRVLIGNLGSNSATPNGTVNVYTVSPVYAGGGTLTFYDNNFEADTSDTPKEDWEPFKDGNNPATVTFHQQRMVVAGTHDEPSTFYMSRTGDYENFRKSRPLQDDDPVEYMIASGSVDAIAWAASFGDLLLGTSGAEYKVTADDAAITPKTVGISTQSFWGSAKLAPLIIGNSVLHSQRFGGRVRDLYYSLEKDGYAGNDLSIMAPHLFEDHRLLQWCYQQTPGSNVWIVRDDGVLLCMTYLKEHNIYGWSRHVTKGKVKSVCTISGEKADVAMLVTERTINGRTRYFLERLADQHFDAYDIKDAFFVDCGMTFTYASPVHTVYGLEHLEGEEVDVLADGSPIEKLIVANGSITLPYDASIVHVGLPFVSSLAMLPMEADIQNGSTLGKKRGYGKAVVRLISSVGGKYGAEVGQMFDIPFLPENWGEACVPFTGDIELIVPGGQATNTSLRLVQDRPLPMHIIAVAIDVDFGEV